ncbi:uncharacterized protein LOC143297714 [Babylonia areolata]|uniref:uncharacterized protein LOC143297714 n=1 Tax=Babylonia areolata TaxID=304850 RepID=UPI003FD5AB4D
MVAAALNERQVVTFCGAGGDVVWCTEVVTLCGAGRDVLCLCGAGPDVVWYTEVVTFCACVVQVVTFRDPSKEPLVGTECQPLLSEGAMCLRTPEDYLCPCVPALVCDLAAFHTMGYCRPGRHLHAAPTL